MSKPGEKHFNHQERAQIILEAVTLGDDGVCSKYSVDKRTLRRWRAGFREGKCPEVIDGVREKRRELDRAWAEKIPGCLTGCVEFIAKASKKMNHKDPNAVHAMAGAMKLVSEVAATWKIIDARISQHDNGGGKEAGQVPAGSNVTPIRRSG